MSEMNKLNVVTPEDRYKAEMAALGKKKEEEAAKRREAEKEATEEATEKELPKIRREGAQKEFGFMPKGVLETHFIGDEDQGVDAITGAAPVISGNGGTPAKPVSGSIPSQAGPQIVQNGPPPSYEDMETPDMRMKDSGTVPNPEQPKGNQAILQALEKEEGPGFWDIIEAGLSGFGGKESAYSKKQGEKRKEASAAKLMEKESAIQKANQLELMAKQAEIAGNADQAQALRQEAYAQKRHLEDLQKMEKEYGLKKSSGMGNLMDLVNQFKGSGAAK